MASVTPLLSNKVNVLSLATKQSNNGSLLEKAANILRTAGRAISTKSDTSGSLISSIDFDDLMDECNEVLQVKISVVAEPAVASLKSVS